MSAAESTESVVMPQIPLGEPVDPEVTRRFSSRLLRSELRLVFGRRRNQAGLLVLVVVPIIIAIAVKVSTRPSRGGPDFFRSITGNGLFVALAALTHRDAAVPAAGRGRHRR